MFEVYVKLCEVSSQRAGLQDHHHQPATCKEGGTGGQLSHVCPSSKGETEARPQIITLRSRVMFPRAGPKAGRVLGKEDRNDPWVPGWGLGVEVRGKIQGLL